MGEMRAGGVHSRLQVEESEALAAWTRGCPCECEG